MEQMSSKWAALLRLRSGADEQESTTGLITWIMRIIAVVVVVAGVIGILYYFLNTAKSQTTNLGNSITSTNYTVGPSGEAATVDGNGNITMPTSP